MQEPTNIPNPPRQPSEQARQLLFGLRSNRFVWLLIGVLWATLGWIVPWLFAKGLLSDMLISASAEQVSGTVLSVKESDGLPVNRIYPEAISYEYSVQGQSFQSSSTTFDKEFAKTLEPGKPITIEVSTLSPSTSRVINTKRSQYGLLGSFTVAFPLFGVVLAAFALGRRKRELDAYINGATAQAKKITAQKYGDSITFRWEFEVDGRLYFGDSTTKTHPSLEALLQAPLLPVVYNPKDPKDNILYIA